MSLVRALLVLGRVSNLPTIWSNCLCGWLIGVGYAGIDTIDDWSMLLWLCAGGTAMYLGGMYLNDACDVAFDRKYRKERPIPSGAISEGTVWKIGIGLLALGTGAILPPGPGGSSPILEYIKNQSCDVFLRSRLVVHQRVLCFKKYGH